MREPSESLSPEEPVEAVRHSARPNLRKRFYRRAEAVPARDGYAVQLDGRAARTPARRVLVAPTLALAQAIAAEWHGQGETVDPSTMPLTRLANAIIDGVSDRPAAVAAEIEKYLASDLVCYRAAAPSGLAERQSRHWDAILTWADQALGARFAVGEGVVHIAQSAAALAVALTAIPADPWRLGAVHAATTLTGSALIALALAHARLTLEQAWQAAHVDEDWNMEQWGRDELAMQRRAFRFADMQAAAAVLASLPAAAAAD